MSTAAHVLLAAVLLASPAAAWVESVEAPFVATEGQPYVPTVWFVVEDQCWGIDGTSQSLAAPNATFEITKIRYDYPLDHPCPGPLDMYGLRPEFVFPAPGEWTLRIVVRTVWFLPFRTPDPTILEFPVEVVSEVGSEASTWSGVKAMYR